MKLKLFLLVLLLALVSALPVQAQPVDTAAVKATAAQRIGNVPLNFVPMAEAGHYIARSGGYSVLVGSHEAYFAVRGAKPGELHAMRMAFEGGSGSALEAVDPLPGVTNDYRGDNPADWRLGVKSYGKLRARQVYPGVDVVYYGDQRQLEFDFVVAPKADASAIALAFSGAGTLEKDAEGNLVAQLNGQPVRIARPVAYQVKDGAKVAVQAEFELAEGKVHLRLGSYDPERELIIDPIVSYVTFLGGTLGETGNAIAVDSTGAVYVTGQTCSTNFPVPAANSTSYSLQGNCNAYVTKFAAGGTSLVYTTLLGGTTPANASAAGNGIAVDASKQAYVIGTTNIRNFPGILSGVRNVYQGGDSDVFIMILNADGTVLRGTYFGGSSADVGYAIALDQSNNIAVVGQTCSWDFPAYNSIQTKIEACVAFAAKLDNALDIGSLPTTGSPSALSAPQPVAGKTYFFSAFFGGAPVAPPTSGSWDKLTYFAPGAIVFDNTTPIPNVQVTWTGGTSGAAPPTWSTGLLAPTPDGTITWQNYGPYDIPTSAFTEAYGVAVDPPGDVFVVGGSNSAYLVNKKWPCSPPGGAGSWGIKLAGSTGDCIYTWTIGSTATDLTATVDTARAVAVDSEGRAYIVGTASNGISTTGSSYDTTLGGGTDAYLVRLNIAGSAMEYGTYLGGTANEQGLGVAVDNSFGAYVVGTTQSENFPIINPISNPNTGMDLPLSGTRNGFLAKFTSDGAGLVFSSYLGGSGSDRINGVAVDADQNVYMAGTSSSPDLETTLLANTVDPLTNAVTFTSYVPPQPTYGGNSDAFIAMVAGASLPITTMTPGSLVFGDQAVGTPSAAKSVQYTIEGSSDVYIKNISVSSTDSTGATTNAFQIVAKYNPGGTTNGADCKIGTIGPNVAAPMTPSTGCQVWIVFNPPSELQQFGTLTLEDDTNTQPHTVHLLGQGSTPTDNFAPGSLSFGTQAVGVTSAPQTITLTNTSSSASSVLLIDSITLAGANPGDFTESDNCQPSVDGQKSCVISILFTPQAVGARTATLTVTDNATGSPHVLNLSGAGSMVSATISPTSYTFPGTPVNGLSTPATFTVTNNDTTQTLNVTAVSVTGNFVIAENTCATVAPSSTCAISIQFSPATAGTLTGTLTVTGNGKSGATNWPATVSLSGSGLGSGTMAVSATSLSFTPSTLTQTLTVTNSATSSTLTLSGIAISGTNATQFSLGSGGSCQAGTVLNSGASCTIVVNYTVGSATAGAVLTITSSATNSPQQVALSGSITNTGGTTPDFTLTPNFSSVSVVQGTTATFSVAVAPQNSFNQSVAFTCTANNGASCSVNPTTVTMDGTTTKSVQVSVGTSSLTLASVRRMQTVFFALLPFTVFGMVLTRKRGGMKLVLLLLAICLVMGMVSCGSGGSSSSSSQFPMTVGVTLTATSSGSTTLTHTQALSVIVTAK